MRRTGPLHGLVRRAAVTRGRFVVLEGLDGAGTTTQQQMLGERLGAVGVPHHVTFEPTRGPIGELLRRAINGEVKLHDDTLGLLFAADRQEHCSGESGIATRLSRGEHVVCDRYVLSSLAYQSAGRIDVDWLVGINQHVLPVDVTVFIDTPPHVAFDRILSRGGQIEDRYQRPHELQRVFDNYRRLMRDGGAFVGELVVVDGTNTVEQVAADVWEAVRTHVRPHNASAQERRASYG